MRLMEVDQGCRGQQVQMLQHLLNTTGKVRPVLELDGVFGVRTDRAVRQYQAGRGLPVDGIVGARTWRSLGVGPTSRSSLSVSRAEAVGLTVPTRKVPVADTRNLPSPVDGMLYTGLVRRRPVAGSIPRRSTLLEPPGVTIGAPWMRVALAEKGVAEVAGRVHNPRILEYHSTTTLAAKSDEVAWCASFVNWCLEQVGIRGIRSARAADWGKFGAALAEPRYGCIVHIYRKPRGVDGATGSSSGNHVAFFVGQTATHIQLLGGNQKDRVRVSSYPLDQYTVKAMRWPEGR